MEKTFFWIFICLISSLLKSVAFIGKKDLLEATELLPRTPLLSCSNRISKFVSREPFPLCSPRWPFQSTKELEFPFLRYFHFLEAHGAVG